jgi:type VI secretion system protein ImpC
VDRENLDEVMARLDVRLELPLPDSQKKVELAFRTLDEFHPDEIYRQVDQFDDYRESEEKSALMNALLHHPHFQGLESAWRGLDWLLARVLKKDTRIEVVIYDLTMDELRADLTSPDDLAETALFKLLIEEATQGPKGESWGLFVGHYVFDLTPGDSDLLGRLARISRQAGVPFLADVHPRLLDKGFKPDDEAAAQWSALRQLPEAAHLGLALPRFLQRVPYGESTKSIDKFNYGAALLWPAPACWARPSIKTAGP